MDGAMNLRLYMLTGVRWLIESWDKGLWRITKKHTLLFNATLFDLTQAIEKEMAIIIIATSSQTSLILHIRDDRGMKSSDGAVGSRSVI